MLMVRAVMGGTIFFWEKFHRVGMSLYDHLDRVGVGIACHNLIPKKKIKGVKKASKLEDIEILSFMHLLNKYKKQKRDQKVNILLFQ